MSECLKEREEYYPLLEALQLRLLALSSQIDSETDAKTRNELVEERAGLSVTLATAIVELRQDLLLEAQQGLSPPEIIVPLVSALEDAKILEAETKVDLANPSLHDYYLRKLNALLLLPGHNANIKRVLEKRLTEGETRRKESKKRREEVEDDEYIQRKLNNEYNG